MEDNFEEQVQEPKTRLTVQQFATKVKEKYPEYKDIDDHVLTQKMIEKYPDYKESVDIDQLKKKDIGNISNNGTQPTSQSKLASIFQEGTSLTNNNVFKDLGKQITPELQQRHDEIGKRISELNKQPSFENQTALQKFDNMAAPILGFNQDITKSVSPKKRVEIDHDINGHWGNIVGNVMGNINNAALKLVSGAASLTSDLSNVLQNPASVGFPKDAISHEKDPMYNLIAGLNGFQKQTEQYIGEHPLPNSFLGNLTESLSSFTPDLAATAVLPEAKLAQGANVLQKAGAFLFNPFTKYLATKGAVTEYGQAKQEGENIQQAAFRGLKGGVEGAKTGVELAVLGGGSGLATNAVMNKAEQLGLAGTKAIATRQLVGLGSDLVAYGLLQPELNAAAQGRFATAKEIADGMGIAAAFRIKGTASELYRHGVLNKAIEETQNQRQGVAMANFIDADHDAIKTVYEQPETAQELNLQALDAAKKAKETSDLSKKQEYVAKAITLTKASNVKSVADLVLNNPEALDNFKNNQDIPNEVKEPFLNKAQEITDLLKPKRENVTTILPEENKPVEAITIGAKDYTPETKKSGVSIILPKQEENVPRGNNEQNIVREQVSEPIQQTTEPTKEQGTKETVSEGTIGVGQGGTETGTTVLRKGTDKVYENNESIKKIGSKEEYDKYLSTIFPNSLIKDVVYHRSKNKFEDFDFSKVNKDTGGGFDFGVKRNATQYGENLKSVLLNIEDFSQSYNRKTKQSGTKYLPNEIHEGEVYSVYEPEQIHILGSKKDIEGFRKWKDSQTTEQKPTITEDWSKDVESTAKALNKLPKETIRNLGDGGDLERFRETLNENDKKDWDKLQELEFDKRANKKEVQKLRDKFKPLEQDYFSKNYPTSESISEAYHKAKSEGNNPELVKAVEDLLGKPKEKTITEENKPITETKEEKTYAQKDLDRAEAKRLHGMVKDMEEPTDAEQVALRYLADGGKVSQEAVNEIAGTVKRARLNTGERNLKTQEAKDRDYVKGNETLDDLAHRLWELNKQKIPETEIKDALMSAIGDHNTRLEASKSYLERYNIDYQEEKRLESVLEERKAEADKEIKEYNDNLISKVEEDIEGGLSEEHLNNLIKQYEAEFEGQTEQPKPTSEGETNQKVSSGETGQEKESGNEPPIEPPTEMVSEGDEEGKKVGVSHESLTSLANKLGLKEPERGEILTPEQYAERGRKLLNEGADPNEVNNSNNELHDRISIARAYLEKLVKNADDIGLKNGFDSEEYIAAKEKVNDYANNVVKKLGNKAGQAMTSLQGERDLETDSFTEVNRKFEEITGNKPNKHQEQKIKELTEENKRLKKKAEEAEKKLIDESNKEIGKSENVSYKEKAKKVADTFRKLKTKPFTFKDENGNDIPIYTQGVSWNDLIEVGAKAIEKTGVILDGVKAILDKVQNEKWYKELSDKDKERFSSELEKHYIKEIENTPEAKNIKRLEKQLSDLEKGIVKQQGVRRELTDKEKELQERIFEEKKKLGLVPSKEKSETFNEGLAENLEQTPEAKNIKRLEKQLEDLREGKVKQVGEKRELTEKEKQLQDEIFEEKKKLGLIKSKELSEKDKEELQKEELEKIQSSFLNKKDNKFTPQESKQIWDYGKKTYLDNGYSYKEMLQNVSEDTGLSWRQVSEAVTTPKIKKISDEMWKAKSDMMRNKNATKRWLENENKNKWVKSFKKVSDAVRGLSVYGHGAIFVGTHAGMNLFNPKTIVPTLKAFLNGYRYAYGNEGNYLREMEQLKNSPNYVKAQRAGLKNDPDRLNVEEFQKSQTALGRFGLSGERGFNAIKVLRQDLFDREYNKLSDTYKQNEQSLKNIAEIINLATGASNLKIPEAVNELTFAGGMEAARWGKLTRNPLRATDAALKWIKGDATPSEKVFAKVWSRRVGSQLATYVGMLGVNAAIQSMVNPNNKVNITDPTKGDWLKFKFGDVTLDPTSGMLSVVNFIKGLYTINTEEQKQLKGDSRIKAMGKNVLQYARGKAAPFYSKLGDVAFKTDYSGNVVPWSNDKPQAGKHKLSVPEYVSQSLPLPLAEAAREMYQSAIDEGVPPNEMKNILHGLKLGAISGTTGFKASETKEKPSAFTEEDKKEPLFKFFIDKGLELPFTSLSSESIMDKEKMTKKNVSDYPKEIQEKYSKTHKQEFKKSLQEILDNDEVYVRKFKNGNGEEISEVSLNRKHNSEEKSIKNLSKDELVQILRIAQSNATKETKKQLFKE